MSAVKSCPLSASSMNNCLTSENVLITMDDIVKSVLPEFSKIRSVSEELDAVTFSPETNAPETLVRFITAPELSKT